MKRITIISLLFLLTIPLMLSAAEKPAKPAAMPAPTVLSIIPAQAEPGSKIAMAGANFGTGTRAYLGNELITPATASGTLVEFIIPNQLPAGVYALYLQRNDGATSRPYNFTVLPLRPQLASLTPESLPSCNQGNAREVIVTGNNFTNSSQLFFDGVVIPSRLISNSTISFNAPQVAGGLHQIMVKNGADNASVSLGLMIETKPDIGQVRIGTEFVNYYELIIEGRNFQQSSTILVDGMKIGGKGDDLAAREKVIYLGCTQLIYQRHPYSPTTKEFRLQVVNSGGEGSQVVTVSAP